MANRSMLITMSPLSLHHEDDLDIDLDLWEVVNPSDGEYSDDSFSVDSLSDDDLISTEDSSPLFPSAISPPLTADGDVLATDLDLDGVGDGDNVIRDEVDDTDLGWAQRRMVFLGGGSRYSPGITYGDDVNRHEASSSPPPLQILPTDLNGDDDEVKDSDLGFGKRRMVYLGGGFRYSLGITYGDYVNRDGCCYDEIDEDHGDDSYDLDDELVPRKVSAKVERERMRKLGKRGIAKVLTSKTSPYSHLKPGCVRGKHGLGMKFRC